MLKKYTETLQARADKGDDDAKLAILLANSAEGDDAEALGWLEVAATAGHAMAQYYYGLYLATESLEPIAIHPGGVKPEPVYSIDVENLDSFLGLTQGVSPDGNPDEPFDFNKWLRKERKRRVLEERRAQKASSEATQTSSSTSSDTTPSSSGESCKGRHAAKLENAIKWLRASADKNNELALVTLFILVSDKESSVYAGDSQLQAMIAELKQKKSGLGLLRAGEIMSDITLYEASADLGFAEAQYELALIHSEQDEHSHQVAFLNLLNKSSSSGYKPAQYYLAQLEEASVEESQSLSDDQKSRVLQLYESASSPPSPDMHACFHMGNILYHGLLGKEVNVKQAMKYWRVGAKLGHPDCLVNLASMHYSGIGTKQDFEKAFYLNQNAAVLGSQVAMANLADMYERGLGVPQSFEQAKYYRHLASGSSDVSGESVLSALQEAIASGEQIKVYEH